MRRNTGEARLSVPVKPPRCKAPRCRNPSLPYKTFCGPECGAVIGMAAIAKAKRIEAKADLDKLQSLKPITKLLAELQTAFNAWVRERDRGRPCISCGRQHQGQWHAGHYLSVGARPELRFHPLNVWLQCAPCNTHLHGNLILFRVNLIKEIGIEAVEWLEGPHEMPKRSREWIAEQTTHYRSLANTLRRASDSL